MTGKAHGARSDRYARQRVFAPLGAAGQERLAQSRVLIVGCGALGTHLAEMLARAGVGQLTIADRDIVEWSNLTRQTLFDEEDARQGTPKAIAAARRLAVIAGEVAVTPLVLDVTAEDARDLVATADLVLDGSDSLETRYLINDSCVEASRPWIYSAVVGAEGMTMNCHTPDGAGGRSACLRCVWPEPAPPGSAATCDTVGVLNGAVAVVTGIAATEAIKILIGGDTVSHELRTFDLWRGTFDALAPERDPDCLACGRRKFDWLDSPLAGDAAQLCGRDTVQVRPPMRGGQIDLAALAARWQGLGAVLLAPDGSLARLTLDRGDLTVFVDGRALIRGTEDVAEARSLYARYVGG